MDKQYWEKVAPDNDNQIFDVLKNDKQQKIVAHISSIASREKTVMDVGCSVGKWLPLLSASFKKVYAVDIADKYIELAKANNAHLENVEYIRTDFSKARSKFPVCDAAVCINAILTPSYKKQINFFNNLSRVVRKGGNLILVVPSLESALYSEAMLCRWDFSDGKKKPGTKRHKGDVLHGAIDIDGMPTKHFLREELAATLTLEGFEVQATEKIEYTWESEFTNPPSWLKAPYPWDWLVVAKKKQ
ncbi:MAG: class I SAM-dependent methyltransferase [Chitinophagales bacterium]|nr:class I SAM-dependent methyltransferase [Chitinophagales bacterium]